MKKNITILITVFFITIIICPLSQAIERKMLVALIDFTDETPNKMALTPDDKSESNKIHISKVMKVVRETTEKSELFELLPYENVMKAMDTQIGKEAAARRYDRFSAARLGKILEVDAILTGEVVQFEKNVIPKDFIINGLDFSKRVEDVVIRVRLINAYNGVDLVDVIGAGNADESLLETISATISNKLSIGFLRAVNFSTLKILKEIESADIIINKEYSPSFQSVADEAFYSIVRIEGNYIYINAGRNRNVSIADLFTVIKDDGAGNHKPAAIYSVSMVERDYSKLVLVEPKGTEVKVYVGEKVQRKTRGAEMKLEIPKNKDQDTEKNKTKQPRRSRKQNNKN
ncbi:MAG: CsgG/HfaB family protein [Synergistaceae bacterium]|nr:CsgG/HfaB family protein [Synergistaceae bacterium]